MKFCLLNIWSFSPVPARCVFQPGQELHVLNSYISSLTALGSHLYKDDYLRSFSSRCFYKIDIDIGNITWNLLFLKKKNPKPDSSSFQQGRWETLKHPR